MNTKCETAILKCRSIGVNLSLAACSPTPTISTPVSYCAPKPSNPAVATDKSANGFPILKYASVPAPVSRASLRRNQYLPFLNPRTGTIGWRRNCPCCPSKMLSAVAFSEDSIKLAAQASVTISLLFSMFNNCESQLLSALAKATLAKRGGRSSKQQTNAFHLGP